MEGTKMTKQERESMLYDEFDKFTSEPGESIHSYYLRYAKLINDMKMIPMSMSNMKINIKFHYQSNTPITQQLIQSPPLQSYAPTVVQQPPTIQPNTGFVVPTFLPADDPIANLNKAMIFLRSTYSSRYPPTNNQLQTSSNPRTQARIQNGQVTVQNVQGRLSQVYADIAGKNQASGARVVNLVGNAGVKDSEWFKDKMLLAQVQEAGVILNEEQHDFLADSFEETDDFDGLQLQTTINFKADHVDAYDSDCDDEATTNAILIMLKLKVVLKNIKEGVTDRFLAWHEEYSRLEAYGFISILPSSIVIATLLLFIYFLEGLRLL
ncbi:hypothetical protein Tco_0697749 [Tanacetum coccineum]